MSYYNKYKRNPFFSPINGEQEVLQELASVELHACSVDIETYQHDLQAHFVVGKKYSSATLLRQKLKGGLVRELHEI